MFFLRLDRRTDSSTLNPRLVALKLLPFRVFQEDFLADGFTSASILPFEYAQGPSSRLALCT